MLRVAAFLLALFPTLACAQGRSAFFAGGPQPIVDCDFTAGISYNTQSNTIVAGPRCPPVIFNRASPKYDFNCQGVLTTYGTDVPDVPACAPGTGKPLGLGIEGISRILNYDARDLTRASWVKHGTVAALTQTGIDGGRNAASLLSATSANGTACNGGTGGAFQRVVSVFLKRVSGAGEVDVSADGVNWTNVTGSLTSIAWNRLPAGGIYSTSVNAFICLRLVAAGDAIAVDYANQEFDANSRLVAPTTPVLTGSTRPVVRHPDNAWIDLAAVSGWNPDHWTVVLRETLGHYVAPTNRALNRAIVQIDDGAGVNAWHLENEQDNATDRSCDGSVGTILNCPDWALIPYQFGAQPTGKVRATVLPNHQLAGLAPPASGLFSVVAFSYDRALGNALTVDTGGPATTLGSGVYFPSGPTPVISAQVSPRFAQGVFKRLVLGAAPYEHAIIRGTCTANDVLMFNATWENPQTTQQTVSVTYTVQSGDTPTSMATAMAAAINANPTLAASGISATSVAGRVFPAHSGSLFVSWTYSVTGARTETIASSGGYSGQFFGYIQQVQVYPVALRGADLIRALQPTSPLSHTPSPGRH